MAILRHLERDIAIVVTIFAPILMSFSFKLITDKEARFAANCMDCIQRATTTQSIFITCTGFFRTISEGSRDTDSNSAGEARRRFITLAAPLRRAQAMPRLSPVINPPRPICRVTIGRRLTVALANSFVSRHPDHMQLDCI
ncbi:MAG: hypothetical protein WBW81_04555 [Methylocella sp.]